MHTHLAPLIIKGSSSMASSLWRITFFSSHLDIFGQTRVQLERFFLRSNAPLFVCRWWRRQRGSRGGGGAGLQGEVFEQLGRSSAQTGAVWRGAADKPGRSDPGAKQRQGPVPGWKGEDPVAKFSGEALPVWLMQMQQSVVLRPTTGHLSFHRDKFTETYICIMRSREQRSEQQM